MSATPSDTMERVLGEQDEICHDDLRESNPYICHYIWCRLETRSTPPACTLLAQNQRKEKPALTTFLDCLGAYIFLLRSLMDYGLVAYDPLI